MNDEGDDEKEVSLILLEPSEPNTDVTLVAFAANKIGIYFKQVQLAIGIFWTLADY